MRLMTGRVVAGRGSPDHFKWEEVMAFLGSPVLTNVLLVFTAFFLGVIVLTLLQLPYEVVEEVGHLLVTPR